jgi:acyl transferase domain-containing protein
MSWGVEPVAMAGHSVGEFTAACLAGVLDLEDALVLVSERGRLMESMPPGSMLSVRLGATEVEPMIPDGLSLACANSPSLSVVAGPTKRVEAFARHLDREGVVNRVLYTSHAFHSSMMDPIVEPFRECVARVALERPRIPLVSTATGAWLSDDEARDPSYWARHARAPVRFAEALRVLIEDSPDRVLLEVGPRNATSTFARQTGGAALGSRVVTTLGPAGEVAEEPAALLRATGQLWVNGVEIDWDSHFASQGPRRVSLPTYPFERTRHWIDVETAPAVTPRTTPTEAAPAGDVASLIERQLDLIESQLALLRRG